MTQEKRRKKTKGGSLCSEHPISAHPSSPALSCSSKMPSQNDTNVFKICQNNKRALQIKVTCYASGMTRVTSRPHEASWARSWVLADGWLHLAGNCLISPCNGSPCWAKWENCRRGARNVSISSCLLFVESGGHMFDWSDLRIHSGCDSNAGFHLWLPRYNIHACLNSQTNRKLRLWSHSMARFRIFFRKSNSPRAELLFCSKLVLLEKLRAVP